VDTKEHLSSTSRIALGGVAALGSATLAQESPRIGVPKGAGSGGCSGVRVDTNNPSTDNDEGKAAGFLSSSSIEASSLFAGIKLSMPSF
jgi:hypothetical protein